MARVFFRLNVTPCYVSINSEGIGKKKHLPYRQVYKKQSGLEQQGWCLTQRYARSVMKLLLSSFSLTIGTLKLALHHSWVYEAGGEHKRWNEHLRIR